MNRANSVALNSCRWRNPAVTLVGEPIFDATGDPSGAEKSVGYRIARPDSTRPESPDI